MSYLPLIGLLAISALWIKGVKSIWSRIALLASLLVLLGVVLPSMATDRMLAAFSIYQQESIVLAKSVSSDLAHGDSRAAQAKLNFFASHQSWDIANDLQKMAEFFKTARQQRPVADTSAVAAEPPSSAASKP